MSRRRVVTERDVRRAAREKAPQIDVDGAAVTPSAVDLARAMGIALRGMGHAASRGIANKDAPRDEAPRLEPAAVAPVPAVAPSDDVAASPLRIAVGADHGGLALKDEIVRRLREQGHAVVDHGTKNTAAVDYPDTALPVARSVASGAARFGIIVDGAGIGSGMVANKVRGVRAAPCHDVTTAANARAHNDANVLTLGGGLIGVRLAHEIVETFLRTPFEGGRHAARVAKIEALDR